MITKLAVGPLEVNTYFVIDKTTQKGIIIDPGAEAGRILHKVKVEGWKIELILLTHGHFDHIGAAKELKDELGCPIVAHQEGKKYLENPSWNLSSTFSIPAVVLGADQYVDPSQNDDMIKPIAENLTFKVLHAPGHTTDSIVFYFPQYKAAFVGDVIFRESVGRTDLRGGNGETLAQSIQTQIFTLPDDITLYPGHGPSTTVGYEKKNNPYVRPIF